MTLAVTVTLGVILNGPFIAVSKEIRQKVGGMIPDSHAPGMVIRATDKTSARESGNAATSACGLSESNAV